MNRHCLTIFPFFPHSESNRLTYSSATRIQLFGFMFVLFFATDVGFINFNDTRQKIIIIIFVAKSVSYSLTHKPSGLLRCTDHFSQLNA